MGHYRGRARHKARKARRRKLDRWERPPVWGPGPLVLFAETFCNALKLAAAAIANFSRIVAQAFALPPSMIMGESYSAIHLLSSSFKGFQGKSEPVTLDELRKNIGGDGASMTGVRFTAEGGFSLN